MTDRRDEFYVGYLERSPRRIAARCRKAVAAIFTLGLLLAATLVIAQRRFDRGTFEYGIESELRGVVIERPYPLLLVPDSESGRVVAHHLVDFGKHGSTARVAGLDRAPVQVEGSRIDGDGQRMVEVHSLRRLTADELSAPEWERLRGLAEGGVVSLGRRTLIGEIVDSKCQLGVMKPGRGKPHRACAVRCLSGGIPPMLRVEDTAGRVELVLLAAADGGPLSEEILEWVAQPVAISGELTRSGERSVLRVEAFRAVAVRP